MSLPIDLSGSDIKCNSVYVGASTPGAAGTQLSGLEITVLDSITAGTVSASKAVVVDSSKKLSWSVSDTAGSLTLAMTATGTGNVDGALFSTTTEASLGTYANGLNAKLDFGTAGKVSGLGGALCAELDLGAGCTAGSYACFEGELNMSVAGSLTGTRTSFFSLNAWGDGVGTFEDNGYLLDLSTTNHTTGDLHCSGNTQAGNVSGSLRVLLNGVGGYITIYDAPATTT